MMAGGSANKHDVLSEAAWRSGLSLSILKQVEWATGCSKFQEESGLLFKYIYIFFFFQNKSGNFLCVSILNLDEEKPSHFLKMWLMLWTETWVLIPLNEPGCKDLSAPAVCGDSFPPIYRTWGLDFFPFNCILFLSQLFFTNYQTKPNWNPTSLVFFLWTSLVVLIEGLEPDLSFLLSEMSLSQNHMSHISPPPP